MRISKSILMPDPKLFGVFPVQRIGVSKDCGYLFERNPMFLEVGDRLRDVPRKHIIVYILIARRSQD